jgi:hypothetical protein
MKNVLPLLILLSLVYSCGTEKEDPFLREQKLMDESMKSLLPDGYKAFKVALRGTANQGKDSLFDQARLNLLAASGYVLVKTAQPDSTRSLKDILKIAQAAKTITEAIPTLIKTDEDTLPTIMENISYVLNLTNLNTGIHFDSLVNESEEHLYLATAWILSQRAPSSFGLYELNRVDDTKLRSKDLQMVSKLSRSLLYYTNDWPYHGERAAEDLLKFTEDEKTYLLAHPWPTKDAGGNDVTAEQSWHQIHGLAYLMRGLNRDKMEDRKEDANSDFNEFVSEAERGGLDNELTWLVGAYVSIRQEKKEKALEYLDKLAASKVLSQEELDAIAETRKYVADRDNGKALNAFSDKLAIVRIAGVYAYSLFEKSEAMVKMEKSPAGKEFLRITKISPGKLLDPADNGAVDSVMNKTKSLLEKVGL